MANSSLKSIEWCLNSVDHFACIQAVPFRAPSPVCDASVNSLRSVDVIVVLSGMMCFLFRCGRFVIHHCISACASLFKYIRWWRRFAVVDREMSRQRNMRPGLITLHENDSFLMSESNSFFVHLRLSLHDGSNNVRSLYLSSGSRMVRLVESMSIPRYVIVVVGPSSFSSAMGMLRWMFLDWSGFVVVVFMRSMFLFCWLLWTRGCWREIAYGVTALVDRWCGSCVDGLMRLVWIVFFDFRVRSLNLNLKLTRRGRWSQAMT